MFARFLRLDCVRIAAGLRAVVLLLALGVAPAASVLRAQTPQGGFEGGRPAFPLMVAGNGYFAILSPEGTELRRWPGGNNNDAWLLPDGALLAATGEATEWDAQGTKRWGYASEVKQGGGVFSCQRLPNGNTLIGENSTGQIFELTPEGDKRAVIQVPLNQGNRHQTLRMVRRYPDGTTLVCRSGANTVELYDAQGTCFWRQQVPGLAFAAVRDGEGNVYVSSLAQIQKWSPEHQLLWEFKPAALGLPIANMTGLHLLPNGNLVVGCYAYGPKQYGAFEVTPDKRLLWHYNSGRRYDSHMAVQLLDPAIVTPLR